MELATQEEKEAFCKAIGNKNLKQVKEYVSEKLYVNFIFDNHHNPLTLALKSHNIDVIKYLIENGAHVNCSNDYGYAPLHWAIKNDCSLDIIKLLINNNADINKISIYEFEKYTPLSAAVDENNFEVAKLLIDEGADANKRNSDDSTALTLAHKYNRTDILNYYYYNSLGFAIFTEKLDEARKLLEDGADVFMTGAKKKLPLIIAVEKENLEAIKLLFEFGGDITMPTAVLKAINVGNLEIINFFLRNNVEINWKYRDGTTLLISAIEKGNFDVIKILIENGAEVNFPDNMPLITAVRMGNFDVVKILIENGASVNPTDNKNSYPLFEALKLDNYDITKYLINKGAKMEAKFLLKDNFQCVKNLIKMKTQLKSVLLDDHFETSTLLKVVETKNTCFVNYLLEQGLQIDSYDKKEESPLAVAAKNRSFLIVQILINAGADINSAKKELEDLADEDENFDVYYQRLKRKRNFSEVPADGRHEDSFVVV
ncbi:putative ankyrin repeat protein RF_0381 isoform X2 [Tribolium madens]|uniref:putative ankyrin repeat protein RF_0381 isoform X2 n=1 Tax=Tribolium madens TaxID=41895 RepID=UPI001CF73402|nr:putative ankyrin repeat protein RF_0381 isoform X2 [Tribolium madens]